MSCDHLHAFVDGELDASDAEAFRAHLAGCDDCQSELPRVAALVALVEAASDERRGASSRSPLTERPRPAVDLEGPELDRRGNRVVSRRGAGGRDVVHAAEHMQFGQYRVTDVLGEGGMGVVYAAKHTLLGRPAAVKVLLPELSRKQVSVQQLFNEARAATAIRHPGIVEIYESGRTDDGAAFIVMELLQGETLGARLERGPMWWSTALALVRQIAGALGAAHAKDIVHRDLKPDNIFLVPDPEVPGGERIKLLDFGLARLAGSETGQHKMRTGAVLGTPTYMAPEQCRGGAVDSRADLYALGCILFELCTGRPPFLHKAEYDMLTAQIHEQPPAISSLVRGVPPEVEALVQRLLAKSPADRVQTADELIELIDTPKIAIKQIARAGSYPVLGPAGSLPERPRRARHEAVVTTLAADEEQASAAGALVTQPDPAPSILDTTPSSANGAQKTTRGPARWLILGGLGGLVVLSALALLVALSLCGGNEAPVQAAESAPEAAAPASPAGTPSTTNAAEPSATVAAPPSRSLATSPAPPEPSNASDSATPSSPAFENGVKAPASPRQPEPVEESIREAGELLAEDPRWRATQAAISIVSVPSGAGVYRGTAYFGRTPQVLKLARGAYEFHLELQLAGYQSHKLIVHPTKDLQIRVRLKRSQSGSVQPAAPSH